MSDFDQEIFERHAENHRILHKETDMGTKQEPGKNDCYHRALPDEPRFTILARDPDFFDFVMTWAQRRENDINCGERPDSDHAVVEEARECAGDGQAWRKNANFKWRKT